MLPTSFPICFNPMRYLERKATCLGCYWAFTCEFIRASTGPMHRQPVEVHLNRIKKVHKCAYCGKDNATIEVKHLSKFYVCDECLLHRNALKEHPIDDRMQIIQDLGLDDVTQEPERDQYQLFT